MKLSKPRTVKSRRKAQAKTRQGTTLADADNGALDDLGPDESNILPSEEWGATKVIVNRQRWFEVHSSGLRQLVKSGEAIHGIQPVVRTRMTTRPLSVYARTIVVGGDTTGVVLKAGTPAGVRTFAIDPAIIHDSKFPGWMMQHEIIFDLTQRKCILQYLTLAEAPHRIYAYTRCGWALEPDGGQVFVLPDKIIGAAKPALFQSGLTTSTAALRCHGTVIEWQTEVAQRALQVPWWRWAIMHALAAPLMRTANITHLGTHGFGMTSRGKTLGLRCCASVYGAGAKEDGYVRTWNATANGIEGICEAHNDLPLCLDEINEADGSLINRVAYTITDGQGKTRMCSDTSQQRQKRWRTGLLSSGEGSIAAKLKMDTDRDIAGGQTIRILDISLVESGLLPECAPHLVDGLDLALTRFYGTVGQAWIESLVQQPITPSVLLAEVEARTVKLLAGSSDPRHRRAARQIALVWLAGDLAIEREFVPATFDPSGSAHLMFGAWREGAGTSQIDDFRLAAQRVVNFIDAETGVSLYDVDASPGHVNRARSGGYKGDTVWLFTGTVDHLLAGLDRNGFLRVAEAQGAFVRGDKPHWASHMPRGLGNSSRPRGYQFKVEALRQWAMDGAVAEAADVGRE